MDDVGRWLLDLGMSEYADAFAAQGIDFELLRELSDSDLQQCGVAKLGHRKKLLKAIAELAASPRSSAHDASDARSAVSPVSTPVDAARRQLTVMFCDLVGSTTLSTQLDPEDLQSVLRSYEDAVAAAVAPYDGHVALDDRLERPLLYAVTFIGSSVCVSKILSRSYWDFPTRLLWRLWTAGGHNQTRPHTGQSA